MPVIHNPNQRHSAAMNQHVNPPSPSIKAIFNQLLDDRGRTLDDFASSNLTRKYFRENLNSRHFFERRVQHFS